MLDQLPRWSHFSSKAPFFGSNFSPLATKTTENSFILIPEASPSRPARDGLPFPSDFGENRQISGLPDQGQVLAMKSLTWKGGTPVARSAAPRTAAPGPARSSRDSQSPRPCCCSWGWQRQNEGSTHLSAAGIVLFPKREWEKAEEKEVRKGRQRENCQFSYQGSQSSWCLGKTGKQALLF